MNTVFNSATNVTGDGTTAATLAPVALAERIAVMDVLRGFALIGILLMNIEWFNRAIDTASIIDRSLTGADYMVDWLGRVLFEGKFYKLFALLFGMGFAIMLTRAVKQQRPFTAMFSRRMAALFVLGSLHASLFWTGDILRFYAIGGMMLLAWQWLLGRPRLQRFNNSQSQLKFSLGLMLLPLLLVLGYGTVHAISRDNVKMTEQWQERLDVEKRADVLLAQAKAANIDLAAQAEAEDANAEEVDVDQLAPEQRLQHQAEQRAQTRAVRERDEQREIAALSQSGFWPATEFRTGQALEELTFSPITVLFDLLPIFLFGYWLVASGKMSHIEQHAILFRSMAYVGMAVGLGVSVVATVILSHPAARNVPMLSGAGKGLFLFSQLVLAAGYLGLVVTLVQSARAGRFMHWLAPLGRMTLTNYLMQSVILSALFYGYGFGQFGHISRTPQLLIVLAIIAGQWLFSRWWLARYRYGPMEWLWRSITYWRWQPLRLSSLANGARQPA